MIGVVIQGKGLGFDTFNPIIYHKFGDRSILDLTIDNCVASAHLQKVIVSLPFSEKKNVQVSSIGHKNSLTKREILGRTPKFNYYLGEVENSLDGLYQAALDNELDHIVRVYANCPLLPTWLINKMVFNYLSKDNVKELHTNQSEYNEGFRVDIFPFWYLAEAFIYQEERKDLHLDSSRLINTQNVEDLSMPNCQQSLAFKELEQAEEFDAYIANVMSGYDITDLLEEQNGNN